MAPNKYAELKAFHQQWNGGTPITDEAEKHRFTQAFAESLRKSDPRWGRKSRANNEGPISKDTIGYWLGPEPFPTVPTDGQLDARDLIMSSGATYWGETPSEAYNNIFARWYPVGKAPVPPDPPTPPADDHKDLWIAIAALRNDLTAVESAVKLLGADVEDHGRRIAALEQAPAPTIPPFSYTVNSSRTWGHAHDVTFTYPPK